MPMKTAYVSTATVEVTSSTLNGEMITCTANGSAFAYRNISVAGMKRMSQCNVFVPGPDFVHKQLKRWSVDTVCMDSIA